MWCHGSITKTTLHELSITHTRSICYLYHEVKKFNTSSILFTRSRTSSPIRCAKTQAFEFVSFLRGYKLPRYPILLPIVWDSVAYVWKTSSTSGRNSKTRSKDTNSLATWRCGVAYLWMGPCTRLQTDVKLQQGAS